MRVADYIINRLYLEGVAHVFMVTGRGALFLTDAVAAHKELKSICVHHEQSAAYAAVAYSQYTGKPAACLVSTGCAGTNALTGVLNAWQDGLPCVFISGQNKLMETSRYTGIPIRTYGQQEADIIPIVSSITKYATMIIDPKRTVYEVEKALHLAQSGRKGPVWIDVPLDVQNMRIEPDDLEHYTCQVESGLEPKPEDVKQVVQSLSESKRPVMLIGSGIRSAEATQELAAFLKKCPMPLTYAASATDVYGAENPLSIGAVGIMGCSRAANFAVQNADLVLVVGCRLSSMTTGPEYCKFARAAKTIVVDIDPVEHSKNTVKIDQLIIADAKKMLAALTKEQIHGCSQDWLDKCQHWKRVFPKCEENRKTSERVDLYCLSECLTEILPQDAVVLSDSGLIELVLPTNIGFRANQRCIHPVSQGSMGFALPAVVGAHFASKRPVVAVIGDGSIMMNLQELETVRYHNIPAKILVVNNNAYAVIRKRQIDMFRSRTIGTDPGNGVGIPDFEKVAATFGIQYVRIEDSSELNQKLKKVLHMDGPVLCEIMGLEDQDYITMGHVRNLQGRIVNRPLEDQMPYLDRDLFLSEMIIEPIDQ